MDATPCHPGDRLENGRGNIKAVCCCPVVCLDLTAQLDANSRDILETCSAAIPDAEGVPIDADLVAMAKNTGKEFLQLRTAQDGPDFISCRIDFLQDTDRLGLVGSEGADLCQLGLFGSCLLYTSPSPRDGLLSRMPSSA